MDLKTWRIKYDYRQRDIAGFLNCDNSVYSRYESGQRTPPISMLIKLAKLYQVSLDDLIYLNKEEILSYKNKTKDSYEDCLDLDNCQLTDFEIKLICAARNSDSRARSDALNLLKTHKVLNSSTDGTCY